METILNRILRRVESDGTAIAFTYLSDDRTPIQKSASELSFDIDNLASQLLKRVQPGGRVVISMSYGMDYVTCFLACLRAGVVAVPVAPLTGTRYTTKIIGIVEDSGASLILVSRRNDEALFLKSAEILEFRSLTMDGGYEKVPVTAYETAYLQYTSGSTGRPKGAIITHRNILENCSALMEISQVTEGTTFCNWLPLCHDMGLVAGLLFPIYAGGHSVLMSPFRFSRDPMSWIRAISEYKAGFAAAPNFAFEQCIKRANSKSINNLDLSNWTTAVNGAEPVRAETLTSFAEKFSPIGFSLSAFMPSYGLAESTVFVSGSRKYEESHFAEFSSEDLLKNMATLVTPGVEESRKLVSCGVTAEKHEIKIVDSNTCQRLADGKIGEIWIAGPSVSAGYWGIAPTEANRFGGRIKSDERGEYLRSGDLGFLCRGELYVTGRLDDLLVINGRNIYASDLERDAASVCKHLKSERTAAILHNDQIHLICEIADRYLGGNAKHELSKTIRACILAEHDLAIQKIVYVKIGGVNVTSSGKVQRHSIKEQYLSGSLAVLENEDRYLDTSQDHEYETIEFIELIKSELLLENVRIEDDLFELGIQSLDITRLISRISDDYKRDITIGEILDHPTVGGLFDLLVMKLQTQPDTKNSFTKKYREHDVVPLTDMQLAYLQARNNVGANRHGAHGYYESKWAELNIDRFLSSWRVIIDRHAVLRMQVSSSGTQNVAHNSNEFDIKLYDLELASEGIQEEHRVSIRKEMSHRVYKPGDWPMFDIRVSRYGSQYYVVHYSFDALVLDLLSLHLIEREFKHIYRNEKAALHSSEFFYGDYVSFLAQMKKGHGFKEAKTYWESRTNSFPQEPILPQIDVPPSCVKEFERRSLIVSPEKWGPLRDRALELGVTQTTLLASCLGLVLEKWSLNSKFALNLTLLDRPNLAGIDSAVGDFTKTLLLEIDLERSYEDTGEYVQAVQTQLWGDLANSDYCGVQFRRNLIANRSDIGDYSVVLTCALGLAKDDIESDAFFTGVETEYAISQTPQVSLDVQVFDYSGGIAIHWDSLRNKFPGTLVDDMFETFKSAIENIHQDDVPLSSIVSIPASHMESWDVVNACTSASQMGLIHSDVLERVEDSGSRLALVTPFEALTFNEVGIWSALLGKAISRVSPKNQLVAVFLPKGWQQVVATIGIVRCGSAYVPIDVDWPKKRLDEILAITSVQFVVTSREYQHKLPNHVHPVFFDELRNGMATYPDEKDPVIATSPSSLAYVIFTSGTTGKPKGVKISHSSAVNTIRDINTRLRISCDDRAIALSDITFDLSVYDIFGILGRGAALFIPSAGDLYKPKMIAEYLDSYGITVWNSVPSTLQTLIDEIGGRNSKYYLQTVMLSGDWIPKALANRILKTFPRSKAYSLGGATEASIWSIIHPIESIDEDIASIPYGKSLANQKMYVLNGRYEKCPFWVEGDLYIGGAGLAIGYWADELNTSERFVAHPRTGERIYRTGDRGMLHENGNVIFLGRNDGQVKINGYRIETSEIEASLESNEIVRNAVVCCTEKRASKQLIAYVALANSTVKDIDGFPVSHEEYEVLDARKRKHRFEQAGEGAVGVHRPMTNIIEPVFEGMDNQIDNPYLQLNDDLLNLLCIFRHSTSEYYALSRARYPSAGSLYAVKIYVEEILDSGEFASNTSSFHLYDPRKNSIIHLYPIVRDVTRTTDVQHKLHLVADISVVKEFYGHLADDFCRLEAGYMSCLADIASSKRVELTTLSAEEHSELHEALDLDSRHLYLSSLLLYSKTFDNHQITETGAIKNIKNNYAFLENRRSYRNYSAIPMDLHQISGLCSCIAEELRQFPNVLNCYIVVRREIENTDANGNFECGTYMLNPALTREPPFDLVSKWHGNCSTIENRYFEYNSDICIVLVSTRSTTRDMAIYCSGRVGQRVSIWGPKNGMGFCAIGVFGDELQKNISRQCEEGEVVHGLVGGTVDVTNYIGAAKNKGFLQGTRQYLREYLRNSLPKYMIPAQIKIVPEIPLTSVGKIDRSSLISEFAGSDLGSDSDNRSRSEAERFLINLVRELLEEDICESTCLDESLFSLGGDSLVAIRLSAEISNRLDLDINVETIIGANDLRDLLALLEECSDEASTEQCSLTNNTKETIII